MSNTDRSAELGGCWPYRGSIDRKGYGYVSTHGFAHRIIAEHLAGTPLPAGINVLHKCDNPGCCNPDHLFLGTQADNVTDMLRKGRQQDYSQVAKGSRHGMAKIDDATALRIFRADGKLDDIAATFGVSRSIVERIRLGYHWNHVTGLPRRKKPSQMVIPPCGSTARSEYPRRLP